MSAAPNRDLGAYPSLTNVYKRKEEGNAGGEMRDGGKEEGSGESRGGGRARAGTGALKRDGEILPVQPQHRE